MRVWPFKRKTPLPPEPIPELVPADSAVERRIWIALDERPDLLGRLYQTQPDTLLIYFEEVGTAAVALTYPDGAGMVVRVYLWLAHDRHRKKLHRDDAPMHEDELRHGITIRMTLPTSFYERAAGSVSVAMLSNDGNVYGAGPLQSMDELDTPDGQRNARPNA